jgi:hypothetical protein
MRVVADANVLVSAALRIIRELDPRILQPPPNSHNDLTDRLQRQMQPCLIANLTHHTTVAPDSRSHKSRSRPATPGA